MGFLKGLASVAGKTLKKLGTIAGSTLKPLGSLAASGIVQSAINKGVDMLPLPGVVKDVAKGAVAKAAEFVTSGKAAPFVGKVQGAGKKLQDFSEEDG